MASDTPSDPSVQRSARWASTMSGFSPTVSDDGSKTSGGLRVAHPDSTALLGEPRPHGAEADGTVGLTRVAREHLESETLAPGAANALGAGSRRMPEAPDDWRTCFERDRDRILHSPAFRRLAGKTQVFIFPDDHVRTRLTHALEVAQVATSVARACRLNVALTEAIALGHDCGHGPGGHASEDALSPYIEEGFDHAPWGAKVSLAPLNLCDQTLDGIANHSWSRPAPSTCEGEVVSWADRIAYVCHDWEDAVRSGVVAQGSLDPIVERLCGRRRSRQLGTFISRLVSTSLDSGRIAMDEQTADALARFREHNYRHIYLRPASRSQAAAVVKMLRALVEHFASSPNDIPGVRASGGLSPADPEALREAVDYVAGMTDRFACRSAASLLGWDEGRLPIGLGP